MPHLTVITEQDQLLQLCEGLEGADHCAIDTEFVPEHTYEPVLCTIQVASENSLALIDTLASLDLSCFWRALIRPDRTVIVHAGAEEMRFCRRQTGQLPDQLFDVQLAAGLVGLGYPLSLGNLVREVLDVRLASAETRTDWRKRPLSAQQMDYALDDVRYLISVHKRLSDMLASNDRQPWFDQEMDTWKRRIADSSRSTSWRRVSGTGNFGPRDLAVLRELYFWRDRCARRLDKPPKWILRDDLLAILARRCPSSHADLQHVRGMGSILTKPWAKELLDVIRKGVELPNEDCPARVVRRQSTDEQMVLKMLSAALIQCAQRERVATTIVGTTEDLRDLLTWHKDGQTAKEKPSLVRGWRGQVCGQYLMGLLDGKQVVRIQSTGGDARLVFEPAPPADE